MTEYTILRINRTAPADPALGPAKYWLRIVQDKETDLVTTGDVTELVDSLYDIDPCIVTEVEDPPEQPEQPEQPDEEKLLSTARDVFGKDVLACRSTLAGDYTATIKIYRSHPGEAYKLMLSVGEVVKTVVASEKIGVNIDVSGETSVELDYAVVGAIAAGWLGTVIGKSGVVKAPKIKRNGNLLYWSEPVTGTIRAEYTTTVDLITVEVPGVPIYPKSDVGKTQDVKILAFYHMMVFLGEIAKPPTDDTVTAGALKQLCGYLKNGEMESPDDNPDEPLPAPPQPPVYGCKKDSGILGTIEKFQEICCFTPIGAPQCLHWTAPNPGGKSLSPETRAAYLAANPNTSFSPVTPTGAEGCGTLHYNLKVKARNCCEDVVPMEADPDNPTEIAAGGSILLRISGGTGNTKWTATGGLYFSNGINIAYGGHEKVVFAPAVLCGINVVRVDDGCTKLSMPAANTSPDPLLISGPYDVVAPGGYVVFSASGGVPPHYWSSVGLTLISEVTDSPGVFQASDTFCGSADVIVTDACTEVTTKSVKSTDGDWVLVPKGEYSKCSPPEQGVYREDPEQPGIFYAGKYKAGISRYYVSGATSCSFDGYVTDPCPVGNMISVDFHSWASNICTSITVCGVSGQYDGEGCCGQPVDMSFPPCSQPPEKRKMPFAEEVNGLYEWKCYG